MLEEEIMIGHYRDLQLIMQLVVSVFCLASLQNKPLANYVVAEIIGIKVVMIPLFMIEDFVGKLW